MPELKPCPFCGKKVSLRRTAYEMYRGNSTISDRWEIRCPECCVSVQRSSCIYQDNDGTVIIERNGAEDTIEAWNRRAE